MVQSETKPSITETLTDYLLQDVSQLEGDITTRHFVRVDRLPDLMAQGNPKLHDLGEIWESIAERGFIDDGKLDVNLTNKAGGKGALIYGNGRNEALYHGWTQWAQGEEDRIPKGIKYDSEYWYIPVVTGLDATSEAAALSLLISHNTLTMMGGDIDQSDIWALFDKEVLAQIGVQINAALDDEDDLTMPAGFDSEDLNDLVNVLNGGKAELEDKGAQIDRAEELNEQWGVVSGDLWIIPSVSGDGEHRLLCGDSTNADDVSRLMDGEKADTTFADPPYGMNLDTDFTGMQSKMFKGKTGGNYHDKIVGDDKPFDPNVIYGLLDPSEVFLWGADYYAERLPNKNDGSWFVWDKRLSEDADKMWGSGFELCWSKQSHKRDLVRVKWAGIFGMETQDTDRRMHANQKPVELALWFLTRYSKMIVYDPFGGSGTTMVACEQLSRQCRMIEIEPKYCSVILQRMQDMGLKPHKVTSDDV